MPSTQAAPAHNRLLAALPGKDRQRLLKNAETVELGLSDVLGNSGDPIGYVYFPTGSVISLVMPIEGGAGLEVGLVGHEGMLGITLMLDVDVAPFHAVVQGAGAALRIAAPTFLGELERSPALQRQLKRYLSVSLTQLAQTAACTRFHVVEARLARWLLMSQDRAHSDTFHVTHVSLATMLGVRRVGITKAANSLQQQKLIRYRRGDITILDRTGLEAASCECYRACEEIYRRTLG
ncbi:Crp/Fnr family transcriptional regulator [Methylococcus sp. EFPC2]|uniref:Crp/Fnr family transcriptional regulator n=1 Tax=Methylococcus sp. EFPC2 TaxID=2812648 RepID=UPI0019672204|nr:Crp/Fnr family transcriptional regulator [Methylococcus sp. EFPC2]QSA97760.1 Crp/Fnr family transcriptional regulator [Methylococcus sp. EFPC2]